MCFGPGDEDYLFKKLRRASSNWREIGRQLGFTHEELLAIVNCEGLKSVRDYLQELLRLWVNKEPGSTTMKVLAKALREAGEERLAFVLQHGSHCQIGMYVHYV